MTSDASLQEIPQLFVPLIECEKVAFRETLDVFFRGESNDIEQTNEKKLEALSREADVTRTRLDGIVGDALTELKAYEATMHQRLTDVQRNMHQKFLSTKNLITQSVHQYTIDALASFRDKLGVPDVAVAVPPEVLQLTQALGYPAPGKIAFIEQFISQVISRPFQLSPATFPIVLSILGASLENSNKFNATILSAHDESATLHSMTRAPSRSNDWVVNTFVGSSADHMSNRQRDGRILHDLTDNVQLAVVLALVIWYGETECVHLSAPVNASADWSVGRLEHLFREDFGMLGLVPGKETGTLLFTLAKGEGRAGYNTLGCSVILSQKCTVQSIQIGDGPVVTADFSREDVMQVAANLVCAVGVYLHLAQVHHRVSDDVLYAFYRQAGAKTHPLRKLMDPLGVGAAAKNDAGLLVGFNDQKNTLFNNFTMQTPVANRRLFTDWKHKTRQPVDWPAFVTMFAPDNLPPIVREMTTWHDAFTAFVSGAVDALGIQMDDTVSTWLLAVGRTPTMEHLRRTIVEGYFNNVIHELAASPSIAGQLVENTLYTATRTAPTGPVPPTESQHSFATMLVAATTGGTVRYNARHNHPWSHIMSRPTLPTLVKDFQATIDSIPGTSLVHPSKVETSIAW